MKWIRRLLSQLIRRRSTKSTPAAGSVVSTSITQEFWSVVANVKREHPVGPEGSQTRVGTRQFRGGTKVYINGAFPGTCDNVVAVGLHRKSRRWISCVVKVRHLENFRVKLIYEPSVIERVRRDSRCFITTKDDAERWADTFREWQQTS